MTRDQDGITVFTASPLVLAFLMACHEASPKPAVSAPTAIVTSRPTDTVVSVRSGSALGDPIVAAGADTTVVTPDSALPAPTYADVPGWLVVGLRHPVLPEGAIVNGQRIERTTVVVDSGIALFPANDHWKSVGRGTPLVYVNDKDERTEIYPDGESVWEADGNSTVVRVRATHIPNDIGWMIPRSLSASVHAVPIVDVTAPDGNRRTWTAAGVRVRAQRRDKLTAEVYAEANGQSVRRKDASGINPETDASMGVDSDTLLNLKDSAHMPEFLMAFQFGNGAVVMVFAEEGYECTTIRAVVFTRTAVNWQEDGYTGACTR